MSSDNNTTLVVCHDAGGAEIISAYVVNRPDESFIFCLDGPAVNIFKRKIPILNIIQPFDIKKHIDSERIKFVLTGTSWKSTIETEVITFSKGKGIKTAAFLDHWVNYRERFGFPDVNWKSKLPDEIWCGDKLCLEICIKLNFPSDCLKFVPNPFFDEIKKQAEMSNVFEEKGTVLYVTEPISEHMEKQFGNQMQIGYTEFTALNHFFEKYSKKIPIVSKIIIRPHPSEIITKYDYILKMYSQIPVEISNEMPIISAVKQAEYVVGCTSMAMVIGLTLNKKVFTSVPDKNMEMSLPFNEIQWLI